MSAALVDLLFASVSLPIAGALYWAHQRGLIRSPRTVRGSAFAVAFWFSGLCAHAVCLWALAPTWQWTRPIIAAGVAGVASYWVARLLSTDNAAASS
jgi:hypothetical protein